MGGVFCERADMSSRQKDEKGRGSERLEGWQVSWFRDREEGVKTLTARPIDAALRGKSAPTPQGSSGKKGAGKGL